MSTTQSFDIQLKNQLQSEIWATSRIEKFTPAQFQALDALLTAIDTDNERNETFQYCEEFLSHTPRSVVALYAVAIISLQRQSVDDSHIVAIIDIFSAVHRWNVVEFLCNSFLKYGENRYLLSLLAQCYEKLSQPENKIAAWERLIRIDFDESEIVFKLAQIKKKEGDIASATNYYKKALHRSVNKQDFNRIHELWLILSDIVPDDIDFFMQIESKVVKHIEVDQVVLLLEELYNKYKEKKQWKIAAGLLKRIFSYNADNVWARKELIECYKELYKGHSNLEEYIRESNLNQSWRNIQEAIADFEKHISFDANNFVFHRNWGVGIIRNISDDTITIDFSRNKQHRMSLKMALAALEILPKDHIWVLRSFIKPDKLKKMVKENVRKTLKILITSFSNAVDMKTIRAELVPYVLNEREWTSWNTRARKVLKTDSSFGTVRDMPDHYEVRTQPIGLVEKMYNSFVAEKSFFLRIRIFLDFLKIDDFTIPESDTELLREMHEYFASHLKKSEVDSHTIAALLTVRKSIQLYPFLKVDHALTLGHYIESSDQAYTLYKQIENRELQQEFIQAVRHEIKDWHILYFDLLREKPSKIILTELHTSDHAREFYEALRALATNYRLHRNAFIWIVLNQEHFPWLADYLSENERICIAMAHLYEIISHEIAARREVVENKKLQRATRQYLFKKGNLLALAQHGDKKNIVQVVSILPTLQKDEAAAVIEIKNAISARFPDLDLEVATESERGVRKARTKKGDTPFRTIQTSYLNKQRELQRIHDVEVPKNSKEIQRAREMGDLKENAEYKSAKERQQMLNAAAARLEGELKRAIIVEKNSVETGKTGFGTEVLLIDATNKSEEKFVLLGPWESDPDNYVISYLSPLGKELINRSVGDKVNVELKNARHSYVVKKIGRAPQLNTRAAT